MTTSPAGLRAIADAVERGEPVPRRLTVSAVWASSQSRKDGCGSGFIASETTFVSSRSSEANRLSGSDIADVFERFDIGIGETDLTAHLRKGRAESQPALGTHGGLQNGAYFRFRTGIVLGRAHLQGTMHLVGEIANGDGAHDNVLRLLTALLA